jgi:L-glyceraldehyde 3-phosphate reductase
VGISTYDAAQTRRAAAILNDLGTPCLIHQPRYNMFDRWIEEGVLEVLGEEGMGCIAFSPLCQGILTNKYLESPPEDSRANKLDGEFHWGDRVTDTRLDKVRRLNEIAQARGQNMAQLATAWVLRQPVMSSALIGASKVWQIEEAVAALDRLDFTSQEQAQIEEILG